MRHKLAFIGPECSGKTTLVEALAKRLRLKWNSEYARRYALEIGRELNVNDVLKIGSGQFENQRTYIRDHSNQNIGLFDTELLSTLCYSKWYYQHHPMWLEDLIQGQGLFTYFLTYPDPEWKDDPSRAVGPSRLDMFSFFEEILKQRNIPFILVKGSLEKRIEMTLDKIREIQS